MQDPINFKQYYQKTWLALRAKTILHDAHSEVVKASPTLGMKWCWVLNLCIVSAHPITKLYPRHKYSLTQ